MAITTRSGKGSALTHSEMDTNLNQIPNGANSSITDNGANVGIGTASPVSLLHVHQVGTANATVIIERATGNTAKLTSGASTGFTIDSDNTNGGEAITRFTQNGTEKIRILPTGGITFNGDTSTANALDDYEEGTWTPTVEGTVAVGTYTAGTTRATYTKVGNTVNARCYLADFSVSGASGGLLVSGLPFNVESPPSVAMSSGIRINGFTAKNDVIGYAVYNTDFVHFKQEHGQSNFYVENSSNLGLVFSVTYKV